jgi:hypothetical protein
LERVFGNEFEGDLIFLDIPVFLFRQVALATQSWTSHVGVVFKDADGSVTPASQLNDPKLITVMKGD